MNVLPAGSDKLSSTVSVVLLLDEIVFPLIAIVPKAWVVPLTVRLLAKPNVNVSVGSTTNNTFILDVGASPYGSGGSLEYKITNSGTNYKRPKIYTSSHYLSDFL